MKTTIFLLALALLLSTSMMYCGIVYGESEIEKLEDKIHLHHESTVDKIEDRIKSHTWVSIIGDIFCIAFLFCTTTYIIKQVEKVKNKTSPIS